VKRRLAAPTSFFSSGSLLTVHIEDLKNPAGSGLNISEEITHVALLQ